MLDGAMPSSFRSLPASAWEQYIVFRADAIHQVINQFINAVIHRFRVVQASGAV